MTPQSKAVLERFPVRKSKKQKAAFRQWLCGELERAGYEVRVDRHRSLVTSHNVVVGNPKRAEVLFTAHYDTCAALPLPNFIAPCNFPAYLIYQVLLTAVIMVLPMLLGGVLALLKVHVLVVAIGSYALLLFLMWWMLDGPANPSNVNDNTSGVVTLLEIALALPPEQREKAAFVFFDNEEKGLFGSAAFYRKHRKEMKQKLLVNFDCVSDGDHILFFPRKGAGGKGGAERLEQAYRPSGNKQVRVIRRFGFYPSDQKHFPVGVGVAALHRRPLVGYCLGRIHTWRDTVMDETNIELLCRGSLRLLSGERD